MKIFLLYKKQRQTFFSILVVVFFFLGCDAWSGLDLIITFDQADGLKPKAPLMMKEVKIGEVSEVELNEQQKIVAKIEVLPKYRKMITMGTTFVLSHDGILGTGDTYIDVIPPPKPGEPIASDTIIKGTSKMSYWIQKGGKILKSSMKNLTGLNKRLIKELDAYAESPEGQDLQKSLEELLDKSQKLGEDSYKLYREQVKPVIKKKADAFLDHLERSGKKEQLKKLKKDLEKLLE
ncbi:MAG: hypothetical protein CMM60_04275 [Rhodospirillaceae bacterium]|nr:hypothetical protein [Rhodospirillaceae bacterium]|tara:strand:- start:12032 stop:12736 length:705 start_codon:yes stop_codon:yes gene_type:complete